MLPISSQKKPLSTRRTHRRSLVYTPRLEALEDRYLLSSLFIEDFNNPSPPDGRILYAADPIYDAIPGAETGGTSVGNTFENGRIDQSYGTAILRDQSGSGFFLHNRTGGGGGPFNGKVWGTIAPVAVTPDNTYELSFYLTNENTINRA